MNIIVGASGQVGSNLLQQLLKNSFPAVAVVRNPDKISNKNIETRKADLFDAEQMIQAFRGGTTAFLITPENPASNDIIGETRTIVENYRKAVEANGIKRIIGLSCIGAHIDGNTGNILMSRILEQAFEDSNVEKVFVRPSYYFSNWLGYRETADQYGVLPTFFPQDFKLEMHSPIDLSTFIANIFFNPGFSENKKIFELVGPESYSSVDVAKAFSNVLAKDVSVQSIPTESWKETLLSVGFTENTAANLIEMTQAVINGITEPEFPGKVIKLPTTIGEYIKGSLVINHVGTLNIDSSPLRMKGGV